ncbi:MAG: hypothetical protein B7Z79_11220 [Thiomonas sp. 20-64-9]|nr:MAG: hypothetical protein B7Z79_11220 [Thiomonas sp. 20-64-9]
MQVLQQRAPIEHGGIGVADQPGNRRYRTRNRRAQRQPAAELPIGRRHPRGDGLDGRGIVALRRVAPLAQQKPPIAIKRGHLDLAVDLIARDANAPLDLLAEELRLAHQALMAITGEYTPEDLLGAIFSSFCIGK